MRGHGGSLKSMQISLICARLDKETGDWPAVHSGYARVPIPLISHGPYHFPRFAAGLS